MLQYTILSARFVNPQHTAAVLQTQEAGAVVASVADTPALWADMLAAVQPAAYVVPPPVVPASVSRFQARAALMQANLLTQAQTVIAGADEMTKLAWADAQDFLRTSPTVAAMGAAMGLSAAQLDALFQAASEIKA